MFCQFCFTGFLPCEICYVACIKPMAVYFSSLCAANMLECVHHDVDDTCVPDPNAKHSYRWHSSECGHTLHIGL